MEAPASRRALIIAAITRAVASSSNGDIHLTMNTRPMRPNTTGSVVSPTTDDCACTREESPTGRWRTYDCPVFLRLRTFRSMTTKRGGGDRDDLGAAHARIEPLEAEVRSLRAHDDNSRAPSTLRAGSHSRHSELPFDSHSQNRRSADRRSRRLLQQQREFILIGPRERFAQCALDEPCPEALVTSDPRPP